MLKMNEFSERLINGQPIQSYSQDYNQHQDDKVFNKCLEGYQKKLAAEKEKILNAESQFEMNTDLRNF